MKKILFNIVCIFLISTLVYSEKKEKTETIDLITYYPAPFGDYENISSNTIENYTVISNPKLDQSIHTEIMDFNPVYFNKSIKILEEICGPYTKKDPSLCQKFVEIKGNGQISGTLKTENGYILGSELPKRKIVSGILKLGSINSRTLANVFIPHNLEKVDNIIVSLHQIKNLEKEQAIDSSGGLYVSTSIINEKWYCIVENRSGGTKDVSISFIAIGI